MSRFKRIPQYRLHKPSGHARVIIDGKHVYLGPYGSPESKEKYARLIAGRFSPASSPPPPPAATTPDPIAANTHLSINELLLCYWQFAKTYFSLDGKPTKELSSMQSRQAGSLALTAHWN